MNYNEFEKLTIVDLGGDKMNKLKENREKKGLTQEELSKLSGVSRVTISNLESGNQDDIKLKTMKVLSQALNTPVEVIFLH